MTCPTLLRRPPAPAEVGRHVWSVTASASVATASRVHILVGGDSVPAQLTRFAMAGGVASLVQALLFWLLAPTGTLPANVLAWGVSTAVANELHRRRTFHAVGRVSWLAAQREGLGLALVGLLVTSGALAVMAVAAPRADVTTQTLLVLAVTATVGAGRFAALRWAFLVRRPRTA